MPKVSVGKTDFEWLSILTRIDVCSLEFYKVLGGLILIKMDKYINQIKNRYFYRDKHKISQPPTSFLCRPNRFAALKSINHSKYQLLVSKQFLNGYKALYTAMQTKIYLPSFIFEFFWKEHQVGRPNLRT